MRACGAPWRVTCRALDRGGHQLTRRRVERAPAAGRGRPGRRPRRATRRPGRRAATVTSVLVAQRATTVADRGVPAPACRRPGRRCGAPCPWRGDHQPPGRPASSGSASSPGPSACLATNSRAASSWSGVLSAKVSTPVRARLAMPVRVPAGGTSSMPGDARVRAIVSMHRSQRTGLATWPTIRRRTSRPSWTTAPSRLETRRVRGSRVEIARPAGRAGRRPAPCARCGRRPATLSGTAGRRRAASAANAPSCSRVPAATIWPAPLLLAGVRPCCGDLGQHLVAVAAEHRGHAGRGHRGGRGHRRPRSRTKTIAASALMTPAPAAAVDLADASARRPRRPAREGVGGVREQRRAPTAMPDGDQQRLGDRGVPDRLGVGLGAVVDQVQAGDGGPPVSRSANAGDLEPGVRKPGVWAPWPGATSTSTPFTLVRQPRDCL